MANSTNTAILQRVNYLPTWEIIMSLVGNTETDVTDL